MQTFQTTKQNTASHGARKMPPASKPKYPSPKISTILRQTRNKDYQTSKDVPKTHITQAGETYSHIAAKYKLNTSKLEAFNNAWFGYKTGNIPIGSTIILDYGNPDYFYNLRITAFSDFDDGKTVVPNDTVAVAHNLKANLESILGITHSQLFRVTIDRVGVNQPDVKSEISVLEADKAAGKFDLILGLGTDPNITDKAHVKFEYFADQLDAGSSAYDKSGTPLANTTEEKFKGGKGIEAGWRKNPNDVKNVTANSTTSNKEAGNYLCELMTGCAAQSKTLTDTYFFVHVAGLNQKTDKTSMTIRKSEVDMLAKFVLQHSKDH